MKNVFTIFSRMSSRQTEVVSKDKAIDNVPEFFCPEYKKLSEYGYIRTIADIIKVLNKQNSYTDPRTLEDDLQKYILLYRERGTVSQSAIDAIRCLIYDYSNILFCGKKLNVNEFARIIDKIPSEQRSVIDDVFSTRQKAKILYAVKFANRICKYHNSNDLVYDLQGLFWENSNRGWHTKLLDDVHPHTDYGVRFFIENMTKAWPSITHVDEKSKKVTLSNELLESYMFTNHEKKIKERGLLLTLKEDYEEVSGCHSTRLMSKEPGTGPIYIYTEDRQIQKACHPSDDTLIQQSFYEKGYIYVLIKNMIGRREYREVEGDREMFYLPTKDFSRPIYDGYYNEIHFDSEEQKMQFIESYR